MGMQTAWSILYFAVPLWGIILNGYVLFKLTKIARRSYVRFEATSGLPLAAMSLSDAITLSAQLVQTIFHFVKKSSLNTMFLDGVCKLDIFLMHTTSAFSVWCWFMLSILRFTAVFYPIQYRTIWKQPRYALKILAAICLIVESWILFFVVYSEEGKICAESEQIPPKYIKWAHLTDITIFYAVPSALRLVFDGVVLFHCYNPFSVMDATLYERRHAISAATSNRKTSSDCDSTENSIRSKMAVVMSASNSAAYVLRCKKRETFMKKKTAMVMRSIIISALNLVLNLPSHILRAWLTIDDHSTIVDSIPYLEPVSQLLYFSQFACNAFYLSTSIYETSYTPRNTVIISHGRHISRCISHEDKTSDLT